MAKFDWIPYFEGKLLTYYEYFALIGSTVLFLLAFLSFLTYLLLNKYLREEMRVPTEQEINCSQDSLLQQTNQQPRSIIHKIERFFFNLAFVLLSIIPAVCSALTVIPTLGGIAGMMLFLSIMVYLDNYRTFTRATLFHLRTGGWIIRLRRSFQFNQKKTRSVWVKIAIISVLFPLFMYRTCLCFYNNQIGYYNPTLGFGINTYFTRLLSLKRACPPGPPCHLYTTLPQDAVTSVFVNLHTHAGVNNVSIYYQEINTYNSSEFYQVQARSYEYKGLDWLDSRSVHTALIMGLKPNTSYLMKVFYENQFWTNAVYKTIPDDPKYPLRMINAGDSGYTTAAVKLTKIISTLKPDVYFIGGDIAYDDNMPACAYTWDYYLGLYGSLTSTLGYLMPIVLTVGNHDVGLNQLPGINITVNEFGPAYLIYFPQHFDRNSHFQVVKSIPPVNRRRTVFYHTFPNMQYVSLDSGYMQLFQGFQEKMLVESLAMYPKKLKFVNYHVPLYSGCERFDRDPARFLYGLFHWVPHFDNFKVMTVYENHVHSFKRTKPLIGNSPKDNGTVYVGDGAFGAIVSQYCKPDITMDIFEKQNNENNFWLTVVGSDVVEHFAYNVTGHVIDHFTQDPRAYLM